MTGYRVGWTAGDAAAVAAFREVKTNIDSGTPWFVQDAAAAALQDEQHVRAMVAEYRVKRDLLAEALVGLGLPDCRPAATIHFWQRVPEGLDGLSFAGRLLHPDIAVVATPGAWISDPAPDGSNPGQGYVRFSLVPTVDETRTACRRIRAGAAKLCS
ncbi:MAG: aminotransferase class I/II-fold pyridoxal phosphate-dependent enzyme [Planctomycetota bacterium]